ncbi:DUF63 family protein [Haloferax mediterranei ATCC 33500]|uniref:DUF63 family protein n=1 Tax=Haloferax mediterranei (strain ATCC 33500 / DSM 1411 / JCM 8866 / NBRC 14739 / NCIMB 2177 / R-4) TaxID=523841 RepID=I3R7U3_HALMT|nr:DUF63 family protein [Haloferax mediterranei]AFK20303.1 putative membrane protein [Haloferax mediterranei ATCC 33500]AHZ23672.1 hypothetical protein BM92_13935 [Haloferax mediterranei ATCC 33500]ELZ99159.1 hypothetical protein C439_14909 [Haloferax mediterranei ATCC 33500]MDX5986942.1 DUF63 family protein [Haloferax mediterranei ATCC 33500]QCQ76261.1 DUF63 family protein [Haloferax mediterranei ATCC 33500]
MAILPEGFALPPLPYLVVLVAGLVGVGVGLVRTRPTVSSAHVLALVPWMVTGSVLHVLYVVGLLPPVVEPLAGTPSVYVTVAIVAGATWLVLDAASAASPRALAGPGLVVAGGLVAATIAAGLQRGTLALFWPGIGLVVSLVISPIAWLVVQRLSPEAATAGSLGLLAIFGHTLDAVSTAVGIDVLGFGERTPLSQVILEVAAALPTAETLGIGWLFVLVKLAVVGLVVTLLADYVREEPTEGALLLGFVAAVGLGPGVHNLLLFAIAGA